MSIKLKRLSIRRSVIDGQGYTGEIEFESGAGEVSLKLTDDLARKVLEACAEELTEVSAEQAHALRNFVGEATGLLIEHKEPAA